MKLNLLLNAFACFTLLYFNEEAKTPDLESKSPTLTQRQSSILKDQCKKTVVDYYAGLNFLIGANIADQTDMAKQDVIGTVERTCFRDSDVQIENSIPVIAQDNLSVRKYLTTAAVLSDMIEKVTVNDNMANNNIYYDSKQNFYYIITTIEQEVTLKDGKASKKKLDIYLNFNPLTKLKPRIFSIQNHKEGVLNSQNLVQIVPDNNTKTNKPGFLFDVTPENADISVDGAPFFNDGTKLEAPPGTHTIVIDAANYHTKKFETRAGDTGTRRIVNELILKHGYLAINSGSAAMPEAIAYIDGNMARHLPLANYQLSVGPHHLEIKDGNINKSWYVSITDENITTLNIKDISNAKWEEKRRDNYPSVRDSLSFQLFYDALSTDGYWIADPKYGNVWVPAYMSNDFQPYFTNGHWAMTDYGNTWISNDRWGWACYHYGRWTYNAYYKWVWVPGYDWAPAWVTWRLGDNTCGWAPLPPDLSAGVGNGCPESWWVFLTTGFLYQPEFARYRVRPENNAVYLKETTFSNNPASTYDPNIYYNSGPSRGELASTGIALHSYHVSKTTISTAPVISREAIGVYIPSLERSAAKASGPGTVIRDCVAIGDPKEVTNRNTDADFVRDVKAGRLKSAQ